MQTVTFGIDAQWDLTVQGREIVRLCHFVLQ